MARRSPFWLLLRVELSLAPLTDLKSLMISLGLERL